MSESIEAVTGLNDKSNAVPIESVANILDRELKPLIADWLGRVEKEPELTCIPLNFEERTGHLPRLMHDVTARLRQDADTKAPISEAASVHGDLRRRQGYPVEMLMRSLVCCRFAFLLPCTRTSRI
jgi:hypothetical protein